MLRRNKRKRKRKLKEKTKRKPSIHNRVNAEVMNKDYKERDEKRGKGDEKKRSIER